MSAIFSSRPLIGVATALLLSLSASAFAQSAPQSGWRMPNLIPSMGSGGQNSGRSTLSKVVDPFGLLPGSSNAQNSNASYGQPKPPSTWKKMNDSTKRMARQTADFLNPFDDAPPKVNEQRLTGSNSIFNNQANNRSAQSGASKSWMSNWMGSQPAESKPKTVNDFLAQPQPQP